MLAETESSLSEATFAAKGLITKISLCRLGIKPISNSCPKPQVSQRVVRHIGATSHEQKAADYFAQTFNQLKRKVTMSFITHQVPKGLQVDEVVNVGQHAMSMHVVRQPHDVNE